MNANPPSIPDVVGNRLPSIGTVRHPVPLLGLLGACSGIMSTFVPGAGIEAMPSGLGLFMVLAGVWFGLVVAFGVWRFAGSGLAAAAVVAATTWIAWEVAVNLATQITDYSLKISALTETQRHYLAGLVAGAVGATLTCAGGGLFSAALRQRGAMAGVGAAGAVLGLLLPWSIGWDHPSTLFVPWQAGVAAMLGHFLAREQAPGG
jgi:hypothetical protein